MSGQLDPAFIASLPPSYFTENVSAPLVRVSTAFAIVQTVFFALFLTSRILSKQANGIEFWLFMPLTYICCMAHCANGLLMVEIGGAGRRALALMLEDPNKLVTWLKLCKAEEFTWGLSVMFPKLSILCLYMKIFTTRPYRMAAYMTGMAIILTTLAVIISGFAMCRPFAFFWDKTIPGGVCGDIMAGYRYIGIPNLLTDIVLLVLPLPAVYHLHTNISVKLGLFFTFISGSFGLVTGAVRMALFFTVDLFADPTYNSITTMSWTTVEPGVYFIAACMLTFRPLKRRIPWLKDINISKLISSSLSWTGSSRSSTGKGYTKEKSLDGKVVRTTNFELQESTRAHSDDEESMKSTSAIKPKDRLKMSGSY
ncbi:hypothetical protein M011DRAFT_433877 [Sporormia fimetaria CBS 119925]|uniref:Rhodopsin domain-containing protein n=1 Tax=Sporormia fimetaria CBS 119925 TaxID=1340428 RepID=A0A6A6UXZ5_9PLEO|nr:hypothetical protein M011DRAFT_433877 [Sporormia fimetaria CBS 119925]